VHRLTISRLIVDDASVAEWEEAIVKQVQVASGEEGTLFFGFARRGPDGSTILPKPQAGSTEYLQFQAYASPEAFASSVAAQTDWWKPLSERLAPLASRAEEIVDDENFAAVVSRDHSWGPETMLNLGLLRFKVPIAGAENYERDARRQIDMVTENELGTVLYGFIRRSHAPSGLLPKPVEANAEYFSLSAYVDADARKLHGEIEHRGEINLAGDHFTFEGDWAWGTAYRSHLASPLETESFPAAQIVAATSRYSTS
jgi:hypothetical protein